MTIGIPKELVAAMSGSPDRARWLASIPQIVADVGEMWSLDVTAAVPHADAGCSWVAAVQCKDGSDAILKVGFPHMEARDEARGLRFWNGDPTVQLLDYSRIHNALLLERCAPGTALRDRPESYQDSTISGLLKRLWRPIPAAPGQFRHLSVMTAFWSRETRSKAHLWHDRRLVQHGLALFEELTEPATSDVLLATDLHAGNVLSAQRLPWLVIDPKPFIGDRAYDATQHLLNSTQRLRAEPIETIARFADLLEVDAERVRLWLFARIAAEPRDRWDTFSHELATRLSRDAPHAI